MRLLYIFGKAFVPEKAQIHIRDYLLKAGIVRDPYGAFGALFFLSIFLTSVTYLFIVYELIKDLQPLLFFGITFVVFAGLALLIIAFLILFIYFSLDMKIFWRTSDMEHILPDYLQLVSTNIKSGMSVERSLWYAIKPRFGILSQEMEIVLKKVMTGHDLSDALDEFSRKYDSAMLRRAFNLLIGELDSGGKISTIIDNLVSNLKENQKMKAEMAASVITYMIFIGTIVIIISPALFALSFNLLSFVSDFIVNIADTGAADVTPFNFRSEAIDIELFRNFSFVAVITVGIFSSMIVSIIERGNIKSGLKYIPLFVIGSIFSYFVFMILLRAVFGGIAI